MWLLVSISTAGLFIAVCAQLQPIVNKPLIPIGGIFTVTCDANRFPPDSIPSHWNVITELILERIAGGGQREPIAVYRPFPIPGFSNVSKFIPTGRNWIVEASGGIASVDPPTNNKATIKIEWVVKDAQCSDAGIYSCCATYLQPEGGTEKFTKSQDVNASTEAPVLTLDPHNGKAPDVSTNTKGEIVKLKCTFEGPGGLVLSWLTGPSGGSKFVPYPTKEDIQSVTPRPTEQPVGCGEYESTLTFKVPAVDTVYMCVVKDGQEEASRKNFKILVKPETRNTGTALDQRLCGNLFLMEVLLWSTILKCHLV
ncbi:unnamed protein product [Lymnaea stagnalis]|uniref:Ig-like domain-containing protein n=1 Tax=Lymnaea stagnalis TaxID=6523 RepID=A0AAV2IH40_LYMST